MDVRLTPEQQALRDAAVKVVDRLGPKAVRDLDDPERVAKLDAAVAVSGWRELRTLDELGAPAASGVEAAIVAEEHGRGLADVSFLGPTLAAELRRLSGAPPATGRETVLVSPGLDALDVGIDGGVAIDAAGAESALTLVGVDGGATLAGVPLGSAEVRTDLTRPVAVPSGPAVPLAETEHPLTDHDMTAWTALALALTAADLVGVMRGAVDLATDYAASREQYGTKIGSFQAVQHLLADALVATEGSRSVALHSAWAVDALPADEALLASAIAKAYCARAARSVCETVIQVHGGIGNTWECLAHLFLRRALVSSELFGGVGSNLARVLRHHGIHELGCRDGLR